MERRERKDFDFFVVVVRTVFSFLLKKETTLWTYLGAARSPAGQRFLEHGDAV